ncbi:hypothetical protein [Pseudomonas sp. 1 R 17]|uniref:hypothetical protein n=1 Tax=Pseudomonas sp. 1 R 17 TaxID=1844091 RepID=UPI0008120E1F|nr:hypothetical protein [Pseudomonas sp. 1 R 17]SAM32956.1 hypothetical protein BN1864_LIB5394:03003 [Pseudomonas sp. 1 R 17]
MKLENLTSLQSQLLKLPVVFSEDAWHEAVYLEQPSDLGDLGNRLGETLEAAYACLICRSNEVDAVEPFYDFGLYRFLPCSDRVDRHWLELRLIIEHEQDKPTVLRIMLRRESISSGLRRTDVFFEPGALMMTAGVHTLIEKGLLNFHPYLNRHLSGDWGDICDEDKLSNEQALQYGERLCSAYEIDAGDQKKLWIITERDRSVTTMLLPSEY